LALNLTPGSIYS
jgi:hypothetical protein